jgi:flagellar biosynthesis GTPase FlhF
MSCSPEVVSWMNECYDEIEALKERERERERHREAQEVEAQEVEAQEAQEEETQEEEAQSVEAQEEETQEVEAQEVEAQEVEAQEEEALSQGWISFKDDINGRSGGTTFSGQNRPEPRFKNPDIQHGYEISIPVGCDFIRKTQYFPAMTCSSAIICGYNPKGKPNIMFEVCSPERGYSCHTMIMSKLEKLISENQITIKKII